jgi:PAS domain S-box-containing protein
MVWQHTPFTLPLLIGGTLAALLASSAWRQRPIAGTRPLTLLLAAVSFWAFTYAIEIASAQLSTKVFWAKTEYFAIVLIPLAWFAFLAEYSERQRLLSRRLVALLLIVPGIILIAVWTNEYHWLYWSGHGLDTSRSFTLVVNSYGPLFWVWVAYAYIVFIASTFLMLHLAVRSPQLSAVEIPVLLIGACLPWFANVVSVTSLNPFPGLDMTPFALLISGVVLAGNIFQYRVLDLRPVVSDVVYDNMRDGIIVISTEGLIVALNSSAQQMLKLDAAAVTGQPASNVFPQWPQVVEKIGQIEESTVETSLTGDKAPIHFELQLSPVYDRRGRLGGQIITIRNISERKRAEAHVRYQATLMRHITDAVITVQHSQITSWNQAAEEMYGWPARAAIGRNVHALLNMHTNASADHPATNGTMESKLPPEMDVLAEAWRSGYWRGELLQRRQDGSAIYVLASVSALRGDLGEPIGQLIVNRDITQHKRAEQALRETQRLESIGLLAGGVAHDFNNLLTSMMTQTSLALSTLPPDSKATRHIEKASTSARRAADLTRQLLAYAGKGKMSLEQIDINALVAENLALFETSVSRRTSVYTDLLAKPAVIEGDRAQIQQVVMNLLLNAIESIPPEGGRVVIRTFLQTLTSDGLTGYRYNDRLKNGRYVGIEVSDTGVGMSAEVQRHIFDPFYTTKPRGRGLGLSATLGIIRAHGGGLHVESEPNCGTRFVVLFPLQPDQTSTVPIQRADTQRADTQQADVA